MIPHCEGYGSPLLLLATTLSLSQTREKGIVEWILIHFSEARGRILFCGHVDPAFLFSSQDSTKIQGLERPFKTRITGFY